MSLTEWRFRYEEDGLIHCKHCGSLHFFAQKYKGKLRISCKDCGEFAN